MVRLPAEPVPGIEGTNSNHVLPETVSCTPSPAGGGWAALATEADPVAPMGSSDFADRMTHIRTNTKKYLVSIQLQGPAGAPHSARRNPP